jgi:hypothetical protein
VPTISVAVHRRRSVARWDALPHTLALDNTPGSPWLVVPPEVRQAFDALTRAGTPLAHSSLGRPLLGVKSGCNDAFVVEEINEPGDGDDGTTTIVSGERRGTIERHMLRPLLRGEAVRPWYAHRSNARIIWTHDGSGRAVQSLPPHTAAWLAPWRRRLEQRSDARHTNRWWSLFRPEAARATHARVVWSDIGKFPRATVLLPDDLSVPLNTCYVLPCATTLDALTIAAILNGPLTAAWLHALAEPARGGYRRFLGWTMALLPIPRDWPKTRTLLAPLAEGALHSDPPTPATLHAATLEAFGLDAATVTPLLAWHSQ